MSTLTPDPQPNDPTFATFTDDADNPHRGPSVVFESIAIEGASADESGVMYFVDGDGPNYALIRVSRAKDVAHSLYGYCVVACAVEPDGTMILRAGGKAIEREARKAEQKSFLLGDANARAAALKNEAIGIALRELYTELALERANDSIGI